MSGRVEDGVYVKVTEAGATRRELRMPDGTVVAHGDRVRVGVREDGTEVWGWVVLTEHVCGHVHAGFVPDWGDDGQIADAIADTGAKHPCPWCRGARPLVLPSAKWRS